MGTDDDYDNHGGNFPPHSSGYEINSPVKAWIFFISAIIWIPYTLLMCYLYYEHKSRNQYPQYFIIQLLALGCFVRCIWLFLYPYHRDSFYVQELNRLAILFQFSAISLLMLMWNRALKITRNIDKEIILRNEASICNPNNNNNNNNSIENNNNNNNNNNESKTSSNTINTRSLALLKARELEDVNLVRQRIAWVVINLILYIVILGTIAWGTNNITYKINLVTIGFLSLLVNIGILKVGLNNYYRLKKELTPVYINNANDITRDSLRENGSSLTKSIVSYCCCGLESFLYDLNFLYIANHRNKNPGIFRMQAQVIRIVLIVSITVALFFIIRALCFIYYPVIVDQFNSNWHIGNIIYPLFYYQFPEFFPNIAIATGISPPKGILRKLFWNINGPNNNINNKKLKKLNCWELEYWKKMEFLKFWCYCFYSSNNKNVILENNFNSTNELSEKLSNSFISNNQSLSKSNKIPIFDNSFSNNNNNNNNIENLVLNKNSNNGNNSNINDSTTKSSLNRISSRILSLFSSSNSLSRQDNNNELDIENINDLRNTMNILHENNTTFTINDDILDAARSISSDVELIRSRTLTIATVQNDLDIDTRMRMVSDALSDYIYNVSSYTSSYRSMSTFKNDTSTSNTPNNELKIGSIDSY